MTRTILTAVTLVGISATLLAATHYPNPTTPPACRLNGVWDHVATIQAKKRTAFSGGIQRKMLTNKNFMWAFLESRRDTLPQKTAADSARYFGMSGGAGRYDVVGNKYTEHLDMFVDPAFEGKSLTATCRVEGNTWYHTFLLSDLGDTTLAGRRDSVTEVWRRVE
jgi:hypothetical protein